MKNLVLTTFGILTFGLSMFAFQPTEAQSPIEPVDMGVCYFNEACDFSGKGACPFCDH